MTAEVSIEQGISTICAVVITFVYVRVRNDDLALTVCRDIWLAVKPVISSNVALRWDGALSHFGDPVRHRTDSLSRLRATL